MKTAFWGAVFRGFLFRGFLFRGFLGLAILFLVSFPARATLITFDVTNVSGNTYQYDYVVTNDTLGVGIEQFSIYFDVGLFQNLTLASAPAGWDPLAIQPDTLLASDGFYDVLALTAPPIAAGATLAGFSVQFDYLGAGLPGSQAFDIFDPISFAVLDSGFTVPAVVAVAGPGSLGLLALGFLSLGLLRRRREEISNL